MSILTFANRHPSPRTGRRSFLARGFSLSELLIVIAIIVIMAAIIYPISTSAKDAAYRTTATSNLRQCGVALFLYADEWDSFPTDSGARVALEKAPTCDQKDYWRNDCSATTLAPLIGSYAYVRSIEQFSTDAGWAYFQEKYPSGMILASMFHGSPRVRKFAGEAPYPPDKMYLCISNQDCFMPNRLLGLRIDGSAKSRKGRSVDIQSNQSQVLFTWPAVFVL